MGLKENCERWAKDELAQVERELEAINNGARHWMSRDRRNMEDVTDAMSMEYQRRRLVMQDLLAALAKEE